MVGVGLAHRQVLRCGLAVKGPAAGGEDHPFGFGLPGPLEDVQRADDVHLGIEGRAGHRDPNIRLGGQVEDELRTATGHELDHGGSGDVEKNRR